MRVKFKALKWLWNALPPSFVINSFTYLPHSIIRRLGPVSVTIEPTTNCNFHCPLCPRTKLTRPYGDMSFTNYKKIIDNLPWTVRIIELYLMGEPLLAKDIFQMIRYAVDKGYHVRISSNASHLKKYTRQVLESGLTELVVAVDGATEETYKQYRIGGNFTEVIDGIKAFVQEKKKRNMKYPNVIFQFIVMKHNEHEIDAVITLAKNLEVDHLIFKRASLMDNTRDLKVQGLLRKRFLPTAARFVRKSFQPGKVDPCRWAFGAMILQDGRITSCCYDWDGKYNKGSVISQPFKKVFQSREYTQMRKQIIGQKLDICKNCDYNTQVTERIF